jgi:[ribosomal protein S5]-alanine N-acetyltransferase
MKQNLPIYPNFPSLNGRKIILRQVLAMDISQLKEVSFYDGKRAKTIKEAFEMQERINQDYENGETFHWAILDKNTGDIVGTCGYYRGFTENTGELGCVLKAKFRGQGYMTEALSLAIKFGFETMKLQKIVAITTKSNTKALQLLTRLNFEKIEEKGKESHWALMK